YDLATVLLSLVAAIVASWVALFVVSRKTWGTLSAVSGSVVMGSGVATMHYVGMEAMRLAGMCHWNYQIVALSVVIAIAVSFVALFISFRLRMERRAMAPLKLAAA